MECRTGETAVLGGLSGHRSRLAAGGHRRVGLLLDGHRLVQYLGQRPYLGRAREAGGCGTAMA